MNRPTNSDEPLIPAFLATGAGDPMGLTLLLAYRGTPTVVQGRDVFLTLSTAIRWNEAEASDASCSHERRYRETLAASLRAHDFEHGPFGYTPGLWALWARVFESDARALLKSRSSKIPADVRDAVTASLG